MNDIMIQYQGFHPSDFTRSYLDSKLSDLHNQAPTGSSLRAVFSRKNKILVANVRIMSAAGQFFATAQGLHLRDVTHKLNERARRQLKRWKDLRIQHRRLRDLTAEDAIATTEGGSDDPSVA